MPIRQFTHMLPRTKPQPVRVTRSGAPVVYVALSGGVDSALSATLLKEKGYHVVGVFLKVWQPDIPSAERVCTWKEDRLDAMRVASFLDIPFITMNLEAEYKEAVVDYLVREYEAGRTPNPDVMCNKYIKFGVFFREARARGADYVATGHYARIIHDRVTGRFHMLRGVDPGKDQSYFLWPLTQNELAHTFFPIGGWEKRTVRAEAEARGLPNAHKKDSQGLCFIGRLDMKEFLQAFLPVRRGVVYHRDGEVVGEHEGAVFYTIGQRHGFTITKKSTDERPSYVIDKDVTRNTLTVGRKEDIAAYDTRTQFTLTDVNWIRGYAPQSGETYVCQERYQSKEVPCRIVSVDADSAVVASDEGIVTPAGQSIVLYDDAECIGGGILAEE